jgi:hypothetical protein
MAKSIQVLGSTGTQFNVTSDKVRGDSFYGYTDGLHTMAFYLAGFIGKIYVEGTLANAPTESDWFAINLDGAIVPLVYAAATTTTIARSFEGNFIFLRVRLDRTHITPANNDSMQHGQLIQVLLNH